MVPPGDVSLVSKIATARRLPRTVLTHTSKTVSQTTQPEPTTINCSLEEKRHPTDCFKSWADYWEQINLIPLLQVTQLPLQPYWESSRGQFLKFHLSTAWGCRLLQVAGS
jgi:hypothetical protein